MWNVFYKGVFEILMLGGLPFCSFPEQVFYQLQDMIHNQMMMYRLGYAQIIFSSKLTFFLLLLLLLCCFSCQGPCLHLLLEGLQFTLIVLWGESRHCVGGQTRGRRKLRDTRSSEWQHSSHAHAAAELSQQPAEITQPNHSLRRAGF